MKCECALNIKCFQKSCCENAPTLRPPPDSARKKLAELEEAIAQLKMAYHMEVMRENPD